MKGLFINRLLSRHRKASAIVFLSIQIVLIPIIFASTGSQMVYLTVPVLFVPPLIVSLILKSRKSVIILSLFLLFLSLHSLRLGVADVNYEVGWSDHWGDVRVAEIISQSSHFDLGGVGFSSRLQSYSLFPAVHIIAATVSRVTSFSPYTFSLILTPLLDSFLVSYALLELFSNIGNSIRAGALATIIFSTCYYYIDFHAQLGRETLAFELMVLFMAFSFKSREFSKKYYAPLIILLIAIVISHNATSYVLVLFLVVFTIFDRKNFSEFTKILIFLTIAWGTLVAFALTYTAASSVFDSFVNVFWRSLTSASSVPLSNTGIVQRSLAYAQYGLLGLFALIGILIPLNIKQRDKFLVRGLGCLALLMIGFAAIARLYPILWSWGSGQRLLIFAFVLLALPAALGIMKLLRWKKIRLFVGLAFVVIVLGTLVQSSPDITGQRNTAIDQSIYHTAIFMRGKTVSNFIYADAAPITNMPVLDMEFALATFADLKDFQINMTNANANTLAGYYFVTLHTDNITGSNLDRVLTNGRIDISIFN